MLYIDSVVGINQIEPDTTIIRVFRRDKYEKLFKNKSIWFSKIDEIMGNCDELERTIPKSFFCTMTAEQREYYERCNAAKDSVYKSFVSCWSKRECDELWKNYDPDSSGFAVVTTVGKLYNEFDKNSVIACEIEYVDLMDKTPHRLNLPWIIIKDDQNLRPAIRLKEKYKSGKFINDNEIRFIGFDKPKENVKGINVPITLSNIIDYAIINPNASNKEFEEISDLLTKKGIRIEPSSLKRR